MFRKTDTPFSKTGTLFLGAFFSLMRTFQALYPFQLQNPVSAAPVTVA